MTALAPTGVPMIHIRVCIDAFTGEWAEATCPARSTIAEIVASIRLSPEHEPRRALLQAWLGEHLVPRDRWHRVRPLTWAYDRPVVLILRLPIGKRGGAGKILSIVAAIALISLTAFIGGGGLAGVFGSSFAQGTMGARLLAAGVSIAGSMALQGLNKPETSTESKDPISNASAPNDFEPGAPLQRVIGRTMVTPQAVVPPFTTLLPAVTKAGKVTRYNQTVTAVYALAGRHQIEQIYIGSVEASSIPDVEIETRSGTSTDAPLTLVTDTRIETNLSLNLSTWETDPDDDDGAVEIIGTVEQSGPDWHRVETTNEPDGFRFEFVAPQGWIIRDKNGNPHSQGTSLRIRMRKRGAAGWGGWIPLPELGIRAREGNDPLRLQLEIRWVSSFPSTGGSAWPPAAKAMSKIKGWAGVWTHGAWTSPLLTKKGDGFAQWHWESDKRIVLYLLKSAYPKGRWQFEVKRSWPFNYDYFNTTTHQLNAGGVMVTDFFTPPVAAAGGKNALLYLNPAYCTDALTITSVQSIHSEYPIADDGEAVTLIAVRAKNRSIDRVRAIVCGVTEDWTGSAWVTRATDNPASWYRSVLRDQHNARPVPDALISTATLIDWAEWCTTNGRKVGFVAKGKSVATTLKTIALCGWASPNFGPLHSVVIDRPRSTPVGIVSQRNAGSFSYHKAFGDVPHGLRISYLDADDDYAPREVIVYRPGYAATARGGYLEATTFESITYEGLNTEAANRARGALDYLWRIWRSGLHRCSMDFEHLEFARGDLVLWETDILGAVTGRGRITAVITNGAGAITAIDLDESQSLVGADRDMWDIPDLWKVTDLWTVGRFGVAIRRDDGAVVVVEAASGDVPTRINLAAPLAMPMSGSRKLIGEGTLVSCGPIATVSREVIIWDIDRGPDLTAQITAVDYAGDVFYGA